jgi:type I restriction enzyme S subunit
MREGYKMTDLGAIPEDWIVTTLKESGEILSGGTPDTKNLEYWNGAISWCTPTDITSLGGRKFIGGTSRSISQLGLQNSSATTIPPYSLIVCTRATIGYCAINLNQITTNQGFKSIIPNSKWDVNFIYYLVNSLRGAILKLSSGSTFLEISKKAFENIAVPFPPLPEQQKIATILSTVDEKIEVIDAQITQTRELKKGLMQKLLTRGISHTKFKDSVLGVIPESWGVVRLGEISSVKGRIGFRGYTKADLVKQGEGALTIGASQITRNYKLDFSNPEYISWDKYEESPEIKVEVGDILVVQRGSSIGKVALVDELGEPATINPSMVLIKKIRCSKKFLFYVLAGEAIQKELGQITTSTAIPMITQKQIKEFIIPLPSLSEQQHIADTLAIVDGKINILTEKSAAFTNLKRGLMQQLLTGKVRVVQPELQNA